MGDVARENRRRFPTDLAVVCKTERLTYADLDLRSTKLAAALAGAGLGAGDRILWIGQNCHRVLDLLLAAGKLGAVLCPVNWRYSVDELAFVIEDWDAKVVFWQEEEIGDKVRAARDQSRSSALWIQHDDGSSYDALVASGEGSDAETDVEPMSAVLAIYTAAFSGRPAAALLSHTGLILQGSMMSIYAGIDSTAVTLNVGPLFHIGMWLYTLPTLLFGGTNVFARRVDAVELCELIESEACTHGSLVETTKDEIVEVNREGRYNLKSLRSNGSNPEWTAMVSPDPSPWTVRPGHYGQTELTGLAAFAFLGTSPLGPHGRAGPFGQLRIFDDDGDEAPTGEAGEIGVRGPIVMLGYHNRPERNAAEEVNGWRRTNDVGRREPDGSITFLGPKTRMLKSGVENVYPAEVENAVSSHPKVAECAVIGTPDPKFIQVVKAVVVLRDGEEASPDEIIDHCRSLIAGYKRPRHVVFVDQLPRDGFAVDYAALDATFDGGGYPGVGTRSS